MLENIRIKNFKAFQDSGQIDLKPLTILCGTNSCGKTTIIQSILLLKQTIESQNLYNTVLLNGRYTHLGSIEDIIFNKIPENNIDIKLKLKIQPNVKKSSDRFSKKVFIPMQFLLRGFDIGTKWDLNKFENKELEIFFTLNFVLKMKEMSPKIIIDKYNLELTSKLKENDDIIYNGTNINISLKNGLEYTINWKKCKIPSYISIEPNMKGNKRKYLCPNCHRNHYINSNIGQRHYRYFYGEEGSTTTKISFINLFPHLYENDPGMETRNIHLQHVFNRLKLVMTSILSNYYYIGPLREEPSRRYIYEEEVTEIGSKGENVAYILSMESDKKVEPFFIFDNKENHWMEQKNKTLKDATQMWLRYMDITKDYRTESKKDIIYLYLKDKFAEKTDVTLADVGFGVSQIIPILVEGLRRTQYQTLILEQPEIHLHPKLQMDLADFFISMILSKKRLIIETHSDHIINRIVRRVIEDERNNILDKINLLYIESPEKENCLKISSIKLDTSRGITRWPRGFFDQSADEKKEIIQAGISKRTNSKKGG